MGWVQGKGTAQGAGSTLDLTLDAGIVVGNRLVVEVYVYGAGITLTKVSDSLGNQGATAGKYDQVVVQPDPFNGHLYVLTAPVTTGGTVTVTATASGSASFMSMRVDEADSLSTATGSAAWDVTAGSNGTFATSMPSGTTAPTAGAGELAVAVIGWTDTGSSDRVTTGTGWTTRYSTSGASGGFLPLVVDYQTPGSGAPVSDAFTGNTTDGGNGYATAVAVFLPAGGSGPQTLSPSAASDK